MEFPTVGMATLGGEPRSVVHRETNTCSNHIVLQRQAPRSAVDSVRNRVEGLLRLVCLVRRGYTGW